MTGDCHVRICEAPGRLPPPGLLGGRYLPRQDRDNDRDINPRDLEHAG